MYDTETPSERVRASAKRIASLPGNCVTVNEPACRSAAKFLTERLSVSPRTPSTIASSWRSANNLHPSIANRAALSWIFLVDTLNFCFWGPADSPRWTVSYKQNNYEGYWALCASVNRALDEGIPFTDPSFYATVDRKTLVRIFRSANNVPIPLLDHRLQVLNEAGKVLTTCFNSSVHTLVTTAEGSAQNFVSILIKHFPSFDDALPASVLFTEPSPEATPLCFYKRAQILVADIWACFLDTQLYPFHDISSLTMFADYRVPQALAFLRAIEYSPQLHATLVAGEQIPHADQREVQIRACSIHAVELIRDEMERLVGKEGHSASTEETPGRMPINSILIDFALWDYATQYKQQLAHVPIHRTKSIFY